jgi:hypothetical protein
MTNSKEALNHYEDSKEKYLNTLVKATNKNNEMMRKVLYIGGAVGLGVLIIIFIVFAFIFKSVTKSSDLRTVQANEAVMTLLTMQNTNKNGEEQLMLTGPSDSTDPTAMHQVNQSETSDTKNKSRTAGPDDMNKVNKDEDNINKKDPIQQANAVDAITTDIVDVEDDKRSEKIKKLEELLRDDNNRVRANAAKVMYDIDNKLSLKTFKEMLENPSKRMRASAVWALGEISSEEALNLILTIKDEDDEIVRYNIINALGKVKSLQKFQISETQLTQIDDILKT